MPCKVWHVLRNAARRLADGSAAIRFTFAGLSQQLVHSVYTVVLQIEVCVCQACSGSLWNNISNQLLRQTCQPAMIFDNLQPALGFLDVRYIMQKNNGKPCKLPIPGDVGPWQAWGHVNMSLAVAAMSSSYNSRMICSCPGCWRRDTKSSKAGTNG